jgi:hypothetical protein
MILANQAKWRCGYFYLVRADHGLIICLIPLSAHGLWGQAKFQNADSAPFAALVSNPHMTM